MKKLIFCLALASATLFADVTGKWTGTVKADTPNADTETFDVTFDLKQSGNDVTGTVKTSSSGDSYAIENGALDGDTLKIQIPTSDATYDLTLTVDGDHMTGQAKVDHGGTKVTLKLDLKKQS